MIIKDDKYWMRHALDLANRALESDQVPVGAVVVLDGKVVGEGWNQPVAATDPTGHAEIIALRSAGLALNNYRLSNCLMYSTLEPCAMCAGAIVHARIARLVFGAKEKRAGAVASHIGLFDKPHLNHRVLWEGGVLAEPCSAILLNFFKQRRNNPNNNRIETSHNPMAVKPVLADLID